MVEPSDPGIVLVDKQPGKSSFSIVRAIRRIFGVKKVGHAGTLDPFASGLLVVCIGRPATRLIGSLMDGEKSYLATLTLGQVSTTLDPEGEITQGGPHDQLDIELVEQVLSRFRGPILQKPPQFSAVKHKGKPLYHYARRGIQIEKEAREVVIYQLEMSSTGLSAVDAEPKIELEIRCSKGTYIRSLAADIGEALGCGAYLSELRRTRSGFFSVANSVPGAYLFDAEMSEHVRAQRISIEEVQKLLQSG